jgi:AcrR family transcriptional regulator
MASAATRDRIVEVATRLLVESGPDAVSTRAVSAAAGVHAPAIYRIFGDKRELMDAVGSHGLAGYLASKAALAPSDDPVDDLRRGWELHIGFGVSNPALYTVIFLTPRPGSASPAERQAQSVLAGIVGRIAAAGRLAMPEAQAVQLVHAVGRGTVLALISQPAAERDADLSARAFDMVRAAVTTDRVEGPDPIAAAAVTVRSGLPAAHALTTAERQLMGEWLDRLAASPGA